MHSTRYLVVVALALSVVGRVYASGAGPPHLACKPAAPDAVSEIRDCATRDAGGQLRIIPSALAHLYFGADGLSAVWIEGVLLHVSRAGRTAPAFPFDNGADYLVEGVTRVLINGKVGFVDASLAEAIPPAWDFASPFDGGVAAVCTGCRAVADGEHWLMVGGRWGYIDRRGREVIPVVFAKEELPPAAEARRRLRNGR
jgi:hypothetical protein